MEKGEPQERSCPAKVGAPTPEPSFDYDPFTFPGLEEYHAQLKQAKAQCPVFFSPAMKTWVVTPHAEIFQALTDPATFSSIHSITNVPTPPPEEVLEVLAQGIPYEGGLVDMDPPVHTVYRKLFNQAFTRSFTPRRLTALEPRIKELVAELTAAFAVGGRGELVRNFAFPLPARVIAEVLGIPESDLQDFKRWSNDWLTLLGQLGTVPELLSAARGVTEFQQYIYDFLEVQRLDPGENLSGDLVRALAEMDEAPPTNPMVGAIMTMIFAGHETTTTLIGNTIRLLLEHPDQMQQVRDDPSLVPAAITETLRYDPPVPGMYRTATDEVEIGGVHMPAGSHIYLSYAAANRDPEVFPEPDRFDVHRVHDRPILSFGRGIHYCIGANLAQLEAKEAVTQLLTALPGLRFAPGHQVRPLQSATVRGNAEIWLEWDE